MLKRTKDRKTANSVTRGGNVRIANGFSLPAGRDYSCPFATDYCESICYAGKLEKLFPGFRNSVLHNWNTLKDMSGPAIMDELITMMQDFVAECDKWNAPKNFRIHVDGDFFNSDYTMAWINVMALFYDVNFWVYTRVPSAAIRIHKRQLDNCSLYFSGDPKNAMIANMLHDIYGINIAMVDDTFNAAKDILEYKSVRCPENNGGIALISPKGSACQLCGYCVEGRGNVLFSRSKK